MSPTTSRLTAEFVESALASTAWDVGNQALYDLCRKHPGHTQPEVIIGKFWLIGRTYAAAVERRRQKDGYAGDRFYTERWFQP
jgi:hypothetical protein